MRHNDGHLSIRLFVLVTTLPETNIAMENGPFEDVFPIKNGDIPWLCWFTKMYIVTNDADTSTPQDPSNPEQLRCGVS